MKLRQVNTPANKAAWTEHFYNGELKVVNGEVETDNENWINLLLQRGFRPADEVKESSVFGEVYQEEQPEPLGTQVATKVENECDQEHIEELIEESREAEKEQEDTSATIHEDSPKDTPSDVEDVPSMESVMQPSEEKDPFSLENLMGDALRVPKPRPNPRRRTKKE